MGKEFDTILGRIADEANARLGQFNAFNPTMVRSVYAVPQTPAAPPVTQQQPQQPAQTLPEDAKLGQGAASVEGANLGQGKASVEGEKLGQGEANPAMRPRPRASEEAPTEVPDAAPVQHTPSLVFSSDTLMQSVIMSEVLGKPVSLRNRNR